MADSITSPENMHFSTFLPPKTKLAFKFHAVCEEDIKKAIDNLKPKNSAGYDGLSSNLVKKLKLALIGPITIILNQTLTKGIFPTLLKIAKVIPLFKAENEHLFNNYRPISLLPTISKIFEKIMFNQIFTYFQTNRLFYNSQYGFREAHSTELASLELIDFIIEQIDDNKLPICTFIDLSKAFDTLDHDILLYKLKHYGFCNESLNLIESYLKDRYQYTDVDGTKSDHLNIKTGVPQGSILGPLLFIIYVNDLPNASNIFKTTIYADDTTLSTTLCSKNNNNHSAATINEHLNKISDWLKLNKLSLNAKKQNL